MHDKIENKTIPSVESETTVSSNGSKHGNDVELVKYLNVKYKELKSEVAKVIVGQDKIIEQIITAILSKGHCLLVGVPGLAKTLLIKTLSEVLGLKIYNFAT